MRKLLCIFLFPLVVNAQNQNNWLSVDAISGLKQLYAYQKIKCSALNAGEQVYLNACRCFLDYVRNDDMAYIAAFENERDRLLKLSKKDGKAELMLINLGVQNGLLKLMDGDDIGGAYVFYKSYKAFYNLDSNSCNALEHQKLNALFQIFAAQVSLNKGWVSWLLGVEGDESYGFQQLESYLQQCRLSEGLYVEALVLWAYCKLKFSSCTDDEFRWLMGEVQSCDSPLLTFVTVQNAIKLHRGDDALKLIQDKNLSGRRHFALLNYIEGQILLNDMNEQGEVRIAGFLNDYKGSSYKADAMFRLARFYHVRERVQERDSILSLMTRLDRLPTSFDKQAGKECLYLAKRPRELTITRFLFDGGHYKKALQVLGQVAVDDYPLFYQVEWWYRKGRIEQLLSNTVLALEAYDRVIELTTDDKRYMGPYAALYATRLMLCEGNKERAGYYLQKARKLNTGEYRHDISRQIEELVCDF